jgi:hypothetical protein
MRRSEEWERYKKERREKREQRKLEISGPEIMHRYMLKYMLKNAGIRIHKYNNS